MHKLVCAGIATLLLAMVLALLAACRGTIQVTGAGDPQGPAAQEVTPTGAAKDSPPALDARALVQERCTQCHDLARIDQARKSPEQWQATVDRMIAHGARLSRAEEAAVVAYLTETHP